MSELKVLLDSVKADVLNNNFKRAQVNVEKILYLLKADYDSGINRRQSGLAFNKLLKVRKEIIENNITDVSYDILHIENPNKKASDDTDIDFSSSSHFFDDIESDDNTKEDSNEKPSEEEALNSEESKLDNIEDEVENTQEKESAEDKILNTPSEEENYDFQFNWNDLPTIKFEDIAGLEDVKEIVRVKVLLPLLHPEATEGYVTSGGGGVCLYGPPGTGKTMMAAAIANTIGAKFCSVTPSDLLHQGAGNTEKAVRALFQQARKFKCSVIYFDEMDSIAPKSTKSQYARQLRSEFLAQLQGISAYGEKSNNILFLICATNKPWDIDSAFLRPGRFGTKVYVDLPDDDARLYIVTHRLEKIKDLGHVDISDDIDFDHIVEATNGFNCSDVTNLLSVVEEISMRRAFENSGLKTICNEDFNIALNSVSSSVQKEDIIKLREWRKANDITINLEKKSTEKEDVSEPELKAQDKIVESENIPTDLDSKDDFLGEDNPTDSNN